MKKYDVAILRNENEEDHLTWIEVCKNHPRINSYTVIDLTLSDWLERIRESDYHCYLLRPPGATEYFKQSYDERIYILKHIMGKPIYPTYEEILVYENKKMLSYWLESNQVPHAATRVFYQKKEALEFIRTTRYPFIAKTAIGAAGSGVKILHNQQEAENYISRAFSSKGIARKWLPNTRKGKIKERIRRRLKDIPGFIAYLKFRRNAATIDPQKYYVIFQEHLDVMEEWRCVRIGDSFFAHKKQRRGEIFSGGGGIDWDPPTEAILDFMKMVTDKRGFLSQAIDIFVTTDNKLYINELQCFFGFIHPQHQMIINGVGGRYVNKEGKWIFEPGTFNENNSYNLRIDHVVKLLDENKL